MAAPSRAAAVACSLCLSAMKQVRHLVVCSHRALPLLLAGKASQIVRLPVPAGVRDELFHRPMMRAGVRQAIGTS